MKKKLAVITIIILLFSLMACKHNNGENKVDTTIWTNENAVYVYIKAGYEADILKNVEKAFNSFDYHKVYVTEKNTNIYTPLVLLFILNESGADKQQEFSDKLNQDDRINHTQHCRDLPFESVDTRYLDASSDTFGVDETLTITQKGFYSAYYRPFYSDSPDEIQITLTNRDINKVYTPSDFPQVKLDSVVQFENQEILTLKLSEPGYFNIIKSVNKLSRNNKIESVNVDKLPSPPPPIWEISDRAVADFINESDMYKHSQPLTIVGLKKGNITVRIDGISREFTVV